MDDQKDKLNEMVIDRIFRRATILEDFAKAYLSETGLQSSEIELVEVVGPTSITWSFRKKK